MSPEHVESHDGCPARHVIVVAAQSPGSRVILSPLDCGNRQGPHQLTFQHPEVARQTQTHISMVKELPGQRQSPDLRVFDQP